MMTEENHWPDEGYLHIPTGSLWIAEPSFAREVSAEDWAYAADWLRDVIPIADYVNEALTIELDDMQRRCWQEHRRADEREATPESERNHFGLSPDMCRRGRHRLLTTVIALAVIGAILALAAQPAFAWAGRYYSLGTYFNASAHVKVVNFVTPGYSPLDISRDNRAGDKNIYVQGRPVRSGYSFDYKRISDNVGGGRNVYRRKYQQTSIPINSFQYKIYRDVNLAPDTCSSYSTIIYKNQ